MFIIMCVSNTWYDKYLSSLYYIMSLFSFISYSDRQTNLYCPKKNKLKLHWKLCERKVGVLIEGKIQRRKKSDIYFKTIFCWLKWHSL